MISSLAANVIHACYLSKQFAFRLECRIAIDEAALGSNVLFGTIADKTSKEDVSVKTTSH